MPRNRPPNRKTALGLRKEENQPTPQWNAESSNSIDAAIITVREDETAAVLARLKEVRVVQHENWNHYIGFVPDRHGRQCSVAVARIGEHGRSAALQTTGILLEDLNPKAIIAFGIGAALADSDVTLGDVVIATTFYDFAITAAIEGTRPEFSTQGGFIRANLQDFLALLPALGPDISGWNSPEAIGITRPEVNVSPELFYGSEEWKKRTRQAIENSFVGPRRRPAPIAITRSIASSGPLMRDPALARQWREKGSTIIAVETELDGIYSAVRRRSLEYPVLAIRGISDIVGFQSDAAWIPYACSAAASFLISLLRSGFLSQEHSSPTLRQHDTRASINARIIILGDSGVGKTSLVQRLAYERFRNDTESTLGLSIVPLRMTSRSGIEIQLHIWDFGGQEVYNGTNRIFMAGGNLYLIVLDARMGSQDASLHYWLQAIESVGGQSPIIVVINKVDMYQTVALDPAIQRDHERIRVVTNISCLNGRGIAELRGEIIESIESTVPVRTQPAKWLLIRAELSARGGDLMPLGIYQELCIRNGVTNRPEQDMLLGFLHDEGLVFHSLAATLSDTIVLNPEWIIAGIGHILAANTIRSQGGEFGLANLRTILNSKRYPIDSHAFLVELMRVFEICLPLFESSPSRYLIPQLLPAKPADISVDFPLASSVQFRYIYKIWFSDLLPRLIVRTYSLSNSRSRWRSGVILEFEGSRGLITEDSHKSQIDIFVAGPVSGRSRLLQIVRSDVDYINRQFPNLSSTEYVVLPQDRSVAIEIQHLQKYDESGVQSVPLVIGGKVQSVDVRALLSMVGTTVRAKGDPVKLFVSYAHSDEALYAELETHLKLLARAGSIDAWNNRRIKQSQESAAIDAQIEHADLILCLVSPDFLASDYFYEIEMKRALERHESGKARLIPIIVRECAWQKTRLGTLQALPSDGKAVRGWRDRDQAWASVVQGIQAYIDRFRHPVQAVPTLSITKIELNNIRCISSFSADLGAAPSARVSVIFGENGLGKSTILRSVALCLLPEAKALSLFEQLSGDLLRRGESHGSITVEAEQADGRRWRCKVLLERRSADSADAAGNAVKFKREVDPEFPQENVFICAYGAGRRSIATADPAGSYEPDAAVTTLFNYNSPLQNPELILRRMIALGKPIDSIMHKLDATLSLDPGSTILDASGITVQGAWGTFVPYGALGDGYQATLAWLSDFLGHQMLFDKDCPVPDISGIVLVDELEQHLHPRWQREIIQSLNQQFPGVQFITTSHSPVCAGGLADLPNEKMGRLVVLERSTTGETIGGLSAIPAGLRYDEIMTSRVIGLDVARDKTTEALQDDLRHAFEKAGGRIDENPDFAEILEVMKSRSVTASEDLREEFVQEQLRRSAEDVEAAIREARKKK